MPSVDPEGHGDYVKFDSLLSEQQDIRRSFPATSAHNWTLSHRFLAVATAVSACVLNAGVAFGFSALLPSLVYHGAFGDLCGSAHRHGYACPDQSTALTGMFTLTTSALNLAAMPSGCIIDFFGPKATATMALLIQSIGFALFACGGDGLTGHALYFGGFLILGVSGPVVMNCVFSFANMFPGREGFITASMVGAFDAASSVFVVLAALLDRGMGFQRVFLGYATVPIAMAFVAVLLWPRGAVEKNFKVDVPRRRSEAATGLHHAPVSQQIRTPEFLLAAYACSVNMLTLNFFIATALLQMQQVQPSEAEALTKAFSILLPLGGVMYIPVIGALVTKIGVTQTFVVLFMAFLGFLILLAAHAVTLSNFAAILSFVLFSFCRPLFYTLGATYIGQKFGFQTFGRLYGLLTTVCGMANLLGQPLTVFGQERGFMSANAVLACLQVTTISLPVLLWKRRR
mmetsp:Transcript_63/g.163  ORF Transcript_63/g.163 Transcript_63/m.163 type:complete len:457 (+) Transcript_63:70-1440(+)